MTVVLGSAPATATYNTPLVYAFAPGATALGQSGAYANLAIAEVLDSDAAYNGTTFTVPTGKGGVYEIEITWSAVSFAGVTYKLTCSVGGVDDAANEATTVSPAVTSQLTYRAFKTLSAGDTVVARGQESGAGSRTATGLRMTIKRVSP